MSNKIEAYPRPWHVGPYYKTDIETSKGRAAVGYPEHTTQGEANAEFVVRAVNAHDALVRLMQECEEFEPELPVQIRDALKRAKGAL